MTLADAIVQGAAELPEFGQPAFVPLMGSVGFFVGGLLAHIRRVPPDERSRWMGVGTWAGLGVGRAIWILVFATDLL
jgi:hypothetical protein